MTVCAICDESIIWPDDGGNRWSHAETGSIYCHHTGGHHQPHNAMTALETLIERAHDLTLYADRHGYRDNWWSVETMTEIVRALAAGWDNPDALGEATS